MFIEMVTKYLFTTNTLQTITVIVTKYFQKTLLFIFIEIFTKLQNKFLMTCYDFIIYNKMFSLKDFG